MSIIRKLLEKLEKYEKGLEFQDKWGIIESEKPIDNFDDIDWSKIELPPSVLPAWVQSEINSTIPKNVKDGSIRPRYIGDFIFQIKYIKKLELDYIILDIKRIKGTKP